MKANSLVPGPLLIEDMFTMWLRRDASGEPDPRDTASRGASRETERLNYDKSLLLTGLRM